MCEDHPKAIYRHQADGKKGDWVSKNTLRGGFIKVLTIKPETSKGQYAHNCFWSKSYYSPY